MSGWNKPREPQRGNGVAPLGLKKNPSISPRLVVGLVVVLVGAAVALFVLPSSDTASAKTERQERPKRPPRTTPPAAVTNGPVEIGSKAFERLPKEERVKLRKAALQAARGKAEEAFPTNWQYKGGKRQDAPEVAEMRKRFPFPTIPFKNPAEVTLHGLLNAADDDDDFNERRIDKRFIEQLKESYKTEIVIGEEDDETVREEKQAMIDLKKRLKPYLTIGEEGEKEIIRLLNEDQKALKENQITRRALSDQLRQAERGGATPEEMKILRDAANRMLSEKGISPIRSTVAESMRRRIDKIKSKKGTEE